MFVAGIDYSLRCPAFCISDISDEINFENSHFYYRLDDKKRTGPNLARNIRGDLFDHYYTEQQRYSNLADWVMIHVRDLYRCQKVYIEDYAFAAVGRTFQIAENCSILKDRLWQAGIEYEVIGPGTIKKFATGKGNASKIMMEEAFCKENPDVDLRDIFHMTEKMIEPAAGIIDSYYVLKTGQSIINNTDTGDEENDSTQTEE